MRKVQDIILKLISVMGICFFTALTIGAIGTGRKLAPFSETVSTVSDNWIKAVGIVLGCIVIIGIIWKYSSRVYIRHIRIAAAVIAFFFCSRDNDYGIKCRVCPCGRSGICICCPEESFYGKLHRITNLLVLQRMSLSVGSRGSLLVAGTNLRQLQY